MSIYEVFSRHFLQYRRMLWPNSRPISVEVLREREQLLDVEQFAQFASIESQFRNLSTSIREATVSFRFDSFDYDEASSIMKASEKSEKLLVSCLTPSQRRSWKKNRYFIVNTVRGNKYRITSEYEVNIRKLSKNNRVTDVYCSEQDCKSYPAVPQYDILLAQKLLLETDEVAFLRTANHWKARNWYGNHLF